MNDSFSYRKCKIIIWVTQPFIYFIWYIFCLKFCSALFIFISTNKILVLMKIFFIWLGIILCGVANGFFYSNFKAPECFIYILLTSLVCIAILIIHRKVTKSWKNPDILSESWSNYHVPIFKITLYLSVIFCFLLLMYQKSHEWESITCITISCASFRAHLREKRYTFKWV